jgi:hypothetical protein
MVLRSLRVHQPSCGQCLQRAFSRNAYCMPGLSSKESFFHTLCFKRGARVRTAFSSHQPIKRTTWLPSCWSPGLNVYRILRYPFSFRAVMLSNSVEVSRIQHPSPATSTPRMTSEYSLPRLTEKLSCVESGLRDALAALQVTGSSEAVLSAEVCHQLLQGK